MSQRARPTPRDHRRTDLARIHVLAAQAGMDTKDPDPDSTYRQMLLREGGHTSAADLDPAGIARVLDHLIEATNSPQRHPKARTGNPMSRLIHHLWGRLYAAEVVRHKDGMAAWLASQTAADHPQGTGWEHPEFLPREVAGEVIKALKAWCDRTGTKR